MFWGLFHHLLGGRTFCVDCFWLEGFLIGESSEILNSSVSSIIFHGFLGDSKIGFKSTSQIDLVSYFGEIFKILFAFSSYLGLSFINILDSFIGFSGVLIFIFSNDL